MGVKPHKSSVGWVRVPLQDTNLTARRGHGRLPDAIWPWDSTRKTLP